MIAVFNTWHNSLGRPNPPIISPELFLEIAEYMRPELRQIREEFRRTYEE
jgi:hypothetical protein